MGGVDWGITGAGNWLDALCLPVEEECRRG
jgi:hypothetical protein